MELIELILQVIFSIAVIAIPFLIMEVGICLIAGRDVARKCGWLILFIGLALFIATIAFFNSGIQIVS